MPYHTALRLVSWAMTLEGRRAIPEGVREAETAKGLVVLAGIDVEKAKADATPEERNLVTMWSATGGWNDDVQGWLLVHLKRGRRRTGTSEAGRVGDKYTKVVHILSQWIRHTHPDLSSYGIDEAFAAADKWLNRPQYDDKDSGEEGERSWSDGWAVRALATGHDRYVEGVNMSHCMEDYEQDEDYDPVGEYFSLRDPNNNPVATMQILGDQLAQMKGPYNEPPEHLDRLADWASGLGLHANFDVEVESMIGNDAASGCDSAGPLADNIDYWLDPALLLGVQNRTHLSSGQTSEMLRYLDEYDEDDSGFDPAANRRLVDAILTRSPQMDGLQDAARRAGPMSGMIADRLVHPARAAVVRASTRMIAYGPEQGMLHRYLREGFDPYDYAYELTDWLEEYACEECGAGDDPDCEECGGEMKAKLAEVTEVDEWIDKASDADVARFREHIEQKSGMWNAGPDRPAYEHMAFRRLVRPTWLVHFTDDPYAIASNGFTHGWDSTEGLGLTTQFSDEARHRGPGYNFAFTLGSRDARNALNSRGQEPKYGRHAVVFWAGGVEAYHYGDEEDQVIFWGPEVDPSRIFALWNGEDNGWCVKDAVDRVVFGVDEDAPYDERAGTKDFEEAAQWTVANHRMLAGTQEGVERVERERQKAASGVEQIFRGEGGTSTKGGAFWSPSEEWAAQFTQTGRLSELRRAQIRTSDIYDAGSGERPYAGDPDAVDDAVDMARGGGFKAIRLNEGMNEPPSIFVFDQTAIQPPRNARRCPHGMSKYHTASSRLAETPAKEPWEMTEKDEYVYHNSSPERLGDIAREGLLKERAEDYPHGDPIPDDMKRIYFSDRELGTGGFGSPREGGLLRVKKSDIPGNIEVRRRFKYNEVWAFVDRIPPEHIEVKTRAGWQPLVVPADEIDSSGEPGGRT